MKLMNQIHSLKEFHIDFKIPQFRKKKAEKCILKHSLEEWQKNKVFQNYFKIKREIIKKIAKKRYFKGREKSMKITLKSMLELEQNKEKSMLEMKQFLIHQKKDGVIFFTENLLTLGIHDPFEIYFYQKPSKESEKRAFPIKKEWFGLLPKEEKKRLKELEEYFKEYYQSEQDLSRCHLKTYQSERFVWIHC